jgi:pimeloyl-ACP methyl ester carboxylesterase
VTHAPVNGLQFYYEIHGSGRPLVLLHGGLLTIDLSFGPLLEPLAASRQVIAVELQGHISVRQPTEKLAVSVISMLASETRCRPAARCSSAGLIT